MQESQESKCRRLCGETGALSVGARQMRGWLGVEERRGVT